MSLITLKMLIFEGVVQHIWVESGSRQRGEESGFPFSTPAGSTRMCIVSVQFIAECPFWSIYKNGYLKL